MDDISPTGSPRASADSADDAPSPSLSRYSGECSPLERYVEEEEGLLHFDPFRHSPTPPLPAVRPPAKRPRPAPAHLPPPRKARRTSSSPPPPISPAPSFHPSPSPPAFPPPFRPPSASPAPSDESMEALGRSPDGAENVALGYDDGNGNGGHDEFVWDLEEPEGAMEEEVFQPEEDLVEYGRWLFEPQLPAPWTLLTVVRVDQRQWVVEGYRDKDGYPQPGTFYHLTSFAADEGKTSHCDCQPDQERLLDHCVHRRLLVRFWHKFQEEQALTPSDNPNCIAILRNNYGFQCWLSVRAGADNARNDAKRLLVRWCGMDRWECEGRKCKRGRLPSATCVHRRRAHAYSKEILWAGVDFADGPVDAEAEAAAADELAQMDEPDYLHNHLRDPVHLRAYTETKPRSHLLIAAPAFCRLSTDTAAEHPFTSAASLPPTLPLGANPRCVCGSEGVLDDVRTRACRIYDVDRAYDRKIKVRRCRCRTRGEVFNVGPDLQEYGLFNWNNEIIITHRLINQFSSQSSCSPTPLTAYHQSTIHSYKESKSPHPFLAKSTFNKLYYAFTDLQELDVEFGCPICGDDPETLIWDGVSIAWSSRYRKSSLQPPTVPTGPPCKCVQPRADLCFLPNKPTREALKSAASAVLDPVDRSANLQSSSAILREFHLLNEANNRIRTTEVKAVAALLEWLAISNSLNSSLSQLYSTLLRQLSAHETILFLLNPSTSTLLQTVASSRLSDISDRNFSELARECPAFGNLFRYYKDQGEDPGLPLRSVAITASLAARAVFAKLSTHTHGHEPEEDIPQGDWRSTGAVYGQPQIRRRPHYAKFREGGGTGAAGVGWGQAANAEQRAAQREADELEDEAEKSCQKFYGRYTEARQTGGLMVGWCSHSFSMGFHNIPRAEGRNDVFSAIFTRWKKAPRTIIYDFACSLGIYCWGREPEYWKNTKFLIDQFHQRDHTKCSEACFLSNYMGNDPALHAVNSSAGECGNAALGRIRKSVSYMNQAHAIKFSRNFLCIWNRCRFLEWQSKNRRN